ncbi:MAG: universal stress protein [Thaumarchaeota archaeon]|nr:universal stress protein [Nitrososphaerota archaeon]MDG6907987.1 universal stress protein [Nitrososphaerota archaeon]
MTNERMSQAAEPTTALLVAVDGSKHSEKLVDAACDLAKRLSAKIALLFVSPYKELKKEYEAYFRPNGEVSFVGTTLGWYAVKQTANKEGAIGVDEFYQAVGDAVLSTLGAKVREKGLTCETLFEVGNPAAKIVEVAEERKVAMIMIGVQGLHGLARLQSLGSVSRRVLENAICPVIVVPPSQ